MILNVIPRINKVDFTGGESYLDLNAVKYTADANYDDEEYGIVINAEGIEVISKGEKGKFYAMKTLDQLKNMGKVPHCVIKDAPEFQYRGFMIDSSRHMQTVEEIKTYIEAAARYKFNIFHWHICDDQGWRMESEKYPLLNEKGSWRDCHGFGSPNMERYGGYYTKDEIRDIVKFCEDRFIEVVPEIDMPGHVTAIVSSYPELSCRGEQIPLETVGGIFKNILCAGKEEVFDFCFGILDEVAELFPCKYVHIGGDEAPKARWCNCEKCQQRIKDEHLNSVEELQGYFANRIIAHLKSKGKEVLAWNESLNSGILDGDCIICDWMDRGHKSEEFANKGGKIIIEDFYHYYLDYPYGMTPLKKTYTYNPYLKKLDAMGRNRVLGVETPIWTEYIEDFGKMCYMCFPRMIAVGERGWVKPENANYADFKIRMRNDVPYLKEIGITPADESEWDPPFSVRINRTLEHFKKALSPASIRATLFPNKDED